MARRVAHAFVALGLVACGTFGASPGSDAGSAPEGEGEADGGATDARADASEAEAAAVDGSDGASSDGSDAGPPCNGAVDCERFVFVTRAQFVGGELGSADAAGTRCKQAADASARTELHGRTWDAWLSDASGAAGTRVVHGTKPYRLVDGSPIVASYSVFAVSPLEHPINKDEEGATLNSAQVWTGSQFNGTATTDTCASWASVADSAFGTIGSSSSTNSGWSNGGSNSCAVTAHLYCFER